jgi:translation initiation factor 3 subunit D
MGPIPPDFEAENPNRAYRYRKIELSETVNLIVRSDVDGLKRGKNGNEYLSVNALNEYDPKITGIDWRKKLDSQPGAVFATELKNNSCKLARWGARALIAGSDSLLLG